MKEYDYYLADGSLITLSRRRGRPRSGASHWIHSYVTFRDGCGRLVEVTASEFNRLLKAGWVRKVVIPADIQQLRNMNRTCGLAKEIQ